MYRAAMGVFQAAAWDGRTAILTGSGNNGGDGFALACILKERGFDCTVFTVSSHLSGDSAHYAARAKDAGVPILPFAREALDSYSILVDCLLGTGFSGSLREEYRQAVEAINAAQAYVVSVDINSGMNGDTGEGDVVVQSDLTVTIGYVKTGLVTQKAGKHMKRLVCADIGIHLIREEGILPEKDCPAWLDRNILHISE